MPTPKQDGGATQAWLVPVPRPGDISAIAPRPVPRRELIPPGKCPGAYSEAANMEPLVPRGRAGPGSRSAGAAGARLTPASASREERTRSVEFLMPGGEPRRLVLPRERATAPRVPLNVEGSRPVLSDLGAQR